MHTHTHVLFSPFLFVLLYKVPTYEQKHKHFVKAKCQLIN